MDTLTSSRLASLDKFTTNIHERLIPDPETASESAPNSQHQDREKEGHEPTTQAQEPQPPQVYTTVGSLYNPQASQPLQAPARRGRNIKWPPTPHSESPRPGLSKSVLSSLPFMNTNHHLTQSPPNNLHNLLHYSPLRQNSDRAVSPPSGGSVSALPVGQTGDTPSLVAPGMLNILRGSSPGSVATFRLGKGDDPSYRNDDHEDGDEDDEPIEEDETIKHMSVRALRNLASYPNPMQRRAQKILSGVKPLPLANSRGQARPSPSYQESTDFTDEQRDHALGGRNSRSDPVAMADILQSEQTSGIRPLRFPPGLGFSSQGIAALPGLQTRRESSPVSILPRGPGAPQPLTAGPPGQRHYRASALESAMHGIKTGVRENIEFEENGLIPNPYNSQMLRGQTPIPFNKEPSLAFDNDVPPFIQDILAFENGKETSKSKPVVDTMRAEDVQPWYPRGLPANFGLATAIIPESWASDYPLNSTHERRRAENLAEHIARTREHFYSGTSMFDKTIAEAIEEKNRRIMHRTIGVTGSEVGVIGGERQKSRSHAKISVQDASRIPRHEHAEPLLSMAFQTFAKYNDIPLNAPF